MPDEIELRKHRCCFTGHRPEKISASEEEVKAWLSEQISNAIQDGFTTFITGMAMGVDLWAGEIVLEQKKSNPALHLIAATPWLGFAARWKEPWSSLYKKIWEAADYRKVVSDHYHGGVFMDRNIWMVDHSALVIAYYNGTAGGTRNTIEYAQKWNIDVVKQESLLDKP